MFIKKAMTMVMFCFLLVNSLRVFPEDAAPLLEAAKREIKNGDLGLTLFILDQYFQSRVLIQTSEANEITEVFSRLCDTIIKQAGLFGDVKESSGLLDKIENQVLEISKKDTAFMEPLIKFKSLNLFIFAAVIDRSKADLNKRMEAAKDNPEAFMKIYDKLPSFKESMKKFNTSFITRFINLLSSIEPSQSSKNLQLQMWQDIDLLTTKFDVGNLLNEHQKELEINSYIDRIQDPEVKKIAIQILKKIQISDETKNIANEITENSGNDTKKTNIDLENTINNNTDTEKSSHPFPSKLRLINRVDPVFPEIALTARVDGLVKIGIIVDIHGKVRATRLISGHLFLREAALTAVQQWTYEPYIIDGSAREAYLTVNVSFQLQ